MMDDLGAMILGDQGQGARQPKSPPFEPGKSYGTPASILDNLQQTESSGNAYAINRDSKAMGAYQFTPDTVAMLHKQGIKFDPFDPAQARSAADYYVSQLASQNGGDYAKALAAYGGFKTKDPSGYVSKVMNGNSGIPKPSQAAPEDPIGAMILGGQSTAPQQQPAAPAAAPAAPSQTQPVGLQAPGEIPTEGLQAVIGQQLTGLGSSIVGGYQGLAEGARTLAQDYDNSKSITDNLRSAAQSGSNAVTQYQQDHTYQPPAGSAGAKAIESFNSPKNPINWPGKAIDYAGDKNPSQHYTR